MAEAQPVGFQWVMEAKARGAAVIHVDPRFSRTSAMADLHVPIRAGSDIAFPGGIINHVLRTEQYFRDYMLAYTNASAILSEDFVDTQDLDGLAGPACHGAARPARRCPASRCSGPPPSPGSASSRRAASPPAIGSIRSCRSGSAYRPSTPTRPVRPR